jgi:hypothetical protein
MHLQEIYCLNDCLIFFRFGGGGGLLCPRPRHALRVSRERAPLHSVPAELPTKNPMIEVHCMRLRNKHDVSRCSRSKG